jgi:MFS family permease
MPAVISSLIAFMFDHAAWLMAISMLTFIAGLVLAPVFITRIPVDYFSHPHRHRLSESSRHPLLRLFLAGVKNLLGAVLVVAGLALLFLPGQGLLMLLAGLMIMNYPGKFALERWLILRPHVLPAVNWLRVKYDHPPLLEPRDERRKGDSDE